MNKFGMKRKSLFQLLLFCVVTYLVVFVVFDRKHRSKLSKDFEKPLSRSTGLLTNDTSLPKLYKMIHDIQKQLEAHDDQMKNQETWLKYERHKQRLNILINNKASNQTQMYRPHVLIDNVKLDCKKKYKFIILVTSFARHFDRRDFIRETWGNHSFWGNMTKNWEVIFNVGAVQHQQQDVYKRLTTESNKYKDMLILDVPEDFHKLSQKVMAGLYWTYTKFQFNFILKTDDDVFIHMKRLSTALNTRWNAEDFVGNVMSVQPAERKGRYGVSLKEWPHKVYDPYCSGGGYLLSQSIIGQMIPFFNWQTPLKIDDAYIGHLVKLGGGKKALHEPRSFAMYNVQCGYVENHIVTHPVKTPKCREFMITKANLELGKLKSHPVKPYKSLSAYRESLKKKQTTTTGTKKNSAPLNKKKADVKKVVH